MRGDDAGDDDHEGSGGAADLGGRSAERGDQKAGHNSAIDSGLRREAGGDREGHGQRQSDQAYGDSGDQVAGEFVGTVVAQAEKRLGEPALLEECEFHGEEQLSQVIDDGRSPRKDTGGGFAQGVRTAGANPGYPAPKGASGIEELRHG